jgi:integration host factor subunit beta
MAATTKKQLIDRIAETTKTTQSNVKTIVQCFLDEVIAELAKDNRLEFRDFGVFEVRERAAREAHNPKTLEKLKVPPKKTVKFKMGCIMKEKLNRYENES